MFCASLHALSIMSKSIDSSIDMSAYFHKAREQLLLSSIGYLFLVCGINQFACGSHFGVECFEGKGEVQLTSFLFVNNI